MGRNEGRGAGLVAGMGEPGRVLLGGQLAGAVQERESRGGAARRGAVEGKKNKGKHRFVQAFFNPAYRR